MKVRQPCTEGSSCTFLNLVRRKLGQAAGAMTTAFRHIISPTISCEVARRNITAEFCNGDVAWKRRKLLEHPTPYRTCCCVCDTFCRRTTSPRLIKTHELSDAATCFDWLEVPQMSSDKYLQLDSHFQAIPHGLWQSRMRCMSGAFTNYQTKRRHGCKVFWVAWP